MRQHIDLRTVIEDMHPTAFVELLERLVLFAAGLLRLHGPRARHYAYDAEELVDEALARALGGDRKCPEDVPVYTFLVWTIKSIVSHEAGKYEHELERVSVDDHGEASEPYQLPSGEDIEDEATTHLALHEFMSKLDDELAEYVAILVAGDGSTAEELAEKTRKSVKTIRNLDRRLARRRAQWNPR